MPCAIKKRSDKSLMFFFLLLADDVEEEKKMGSKEKLTAQEIHSS